MRKRWWLAIYPLAVCLCLLANATSLEAQGNDGAVEAEVLCEADGTRCRELTARIELDGGISADLALAFQQASGLDPSSLVIEAEIVDPRDPELAARLPRDTFIPSDFPVLLRIEPSAESDLAFRRNWTLELITENLEHSAHTPLRLFRAPEGGRFQDISLGLGSGSLRILAGGNDFSEFVVAADLRPFALVIREKLARLEALVAANADRMPNAVDELESRLDGVRADAASGELAQALEGVGELLAFVRAESGESIPELNSRRSGQQGVAGQLLAAGSSLAHSLALGLQAQQQQALGAVSRSFELDGGLDLELTLRFEEAFDVDPRGLDVAAEIVDVTDPALLARLPEGVQVPEEFPVLLRINPKAGVEQAFSGVFDIELRTDSLDFVGGTPMRLFRAPDGGAFEDITRTFGFGSLRILAGGHDFSEFVIARDLRPVDRVLGDKLGRLEAFLEENGASLPESLRLELGAALDELEGEIAAGADEAAVDTLEALQATVRAASSEDIPALWRSNEALVNVAGGLRSIAQTLRFSLELKMSPLEADPGDVNRDGRVDVGDVLHLIGRVFGES